MNPREDFPISVIVKDVSGSIFFSYIIAEFEDREVGNISLSGDSILFTINENQFSVSLTRMLHAMWKHLKDCEATK